MNEKFEPVTQIVEYVKENGIRIERRVQLIRQWQSQQGDEMLLVFDEMRQAPRSLRLDRIRRMTPVAPTREAEWEEGDKFDMLLNDKAGQAFPVEVEIISLAGSQVVFGTTSYPQLHRIVSRETFKELTE